MIQQLLFLVVSSLGLVPALAQEGAHQDASTILERLQATEDKDARELLIAELGDLGRDAKPALDDLLLMYRAALLFEEPGREVLLEALTQIGAMEPVFSEPGVRVPWTWTNKRTWAGMSRSQTWNRSPLRKALTSVLKVGSPQEIEAFLGIPGVAYDVSANVESKNAAFQAALIGLSSPKQKGLWANALRSTYPERSQDTMDDILLAQSMILAEGSAHQAMFRLASLFGHGYEPEKGTFQDGWVAVLQELIDSSFAVERETAVFIIAGLPSSPQRPEWLVELLDDEDPSVVRTAIWAVGREEFDSSRIPFPPIAIPGALDTSPPMGRGKFGGRLGGRRRAKDRPQETIFESANRIATFYSPPELLPVHESSWGSKYGELFRQRLQLHLESETQEDMAFWSLSRMPHNGTVYLERIELERQRVELLLSWDEPLWSWDERYWRLLITRNCGPSPAAAERELEQYWGLPAKEFNVATITFLAHTYSLETQECLAAHFEVLTAEFMRLADCFPTIEGELAVVLVDAARKEGGTVLSLLPRCKGGPEALVSLLSSEVALTRLTALVALAGMGEEALFASDPVRAMMSVTLDDQELEFIQSTWEQVQPKK